MVLKSKDEGCGKGLIIDRLIGNHILGKGCYVQVTNIDGLLGKFNSILMNKLLVNADEVSMTKSQANDIKNMIPGETMMFEMKGLNKFPLKSEIDFIITSNEDNCVHIDMSDRRYFILKVDDSNANDQDYYMAFRKYCEDPETAFNVYKYLMSIDISEFNPHHIPETEEKQMYRENAIPTSIRFMQHFAESRFENTPFNQWEQRVLPDYLFSQFCQYCDAQRETKKWTSKSFQMSITKYLGIKADI